VEWKRKAFFRFVDIFHNASWSQELKAKVQYFVYYKINQHQGVIFGNMKICYGFKIIYIYMFLPMDGAEGIMFSNYSSSSYVCACLHARVEAFTNQLVVNFYLSQICCTAFVVPIKRITLEDFLKF